MVGLHGGSCTAHQLRRRLKAHCLSRFRRLGIPFVAFNRPDYKTRLPFCLDRGNDLFTAEGKWGHDLTFPALWERFGKPNGCTGIVAIRDSMAVPVAIIAASLYSQECDADDSARGLGIFRIRDVTHRSYEELALHPGTPPGRDTGFVPEVKQGPDVERPKLQCFDPEVVKQMLVQDHNMTTDELIDLNALWFTYWKKCADEVTVPICMLLVSMRKRSWVIPEERES